MVMLRENSSKGDFILSNEEIELVIRTCVRSSICTFLAIFLAHLYLHFHMCFYRFIVYFSTSFFFIFCTQCTIQ